MTDSSNKRKIKSTLKMDLLKCFGADFQIGIKSPLKFAGETGNAIIYPVGHHLAIRDIFVREELRKNDIMFIYNDDDVLKMTSLDTTKDYSLLLVCEKKLNAAIISIYNLSKLNFKSIMQFKAKRKVISTIYSEFIYASFSLDGNYIASIGKVRDNDELHGIIWDVQIFQAYKPDNYKPKCVFPLPKNVTKITIDNKILCTSGNQHLSFWYIYENSVKEFKTGIRNLNISGSNFVDHEWLTMKFPTLAAITEQKDLYIFEGISDSKNIGSNLLKREDADDDDDSNLSLRIEKFIIKQHLTNIFNDEEIIPNILKCFNNGIIIGSTKGHLLFIEKYTSGDAINFSPIRYTKREKEASVTGLTVTKDQEFIACSYESNEIAFFNIKNIFESLKIPNFELKMNLVCDGFHQGPITTMDVAYQRPIIITTSNTDKTVRIWNFITGHCEYCKIILTEKEKNHEKEMEILSVAIHPNGYYIAISDKEMIRFFHLCYKELRFYNNDSTSNEAAHSECYLLKFSHGGHLLAAVSGRCLYIIRSYTRETIKTFETLHTSKIERIFFHELDYYIYTVGSDGMVVEYNLFNFHYEKISDRPLVYFSGCFCEISKNQFCILSVGNEMNSENHIINEVICTQIETHGQPNAPNSQTKDQNNSNNNNTNNNVNNNNLQNSVNNNINSIIGEDNILSGLKKNSRNIENYISRVKEELTSVCGLKTRRLEIGAYATGSSSGYLSLYPNLLYLDSKEKKNYSKHYVYPWKSIKCHRGKITHIEFNKDTNLIFSAGDDGNLFIYCLQEIQEGENLINPDLENANSNNHISSLLDEGLGDNVLYLLSSIFVKEEEILKQNNLIDNYKNQEEKLRAENINKLKEREIELNKRRDIETRELKERLTEERLAREGIIGHYKEQIENLKNQQEQILADKEKQYKERIDQMSNTIHDLNSKIYSLKSEHEIELKKKDEGYEKKFKEIDIELKSKFKEIKNNNDKLSNELKLRQQLEEYKFIHLDQEHEQEINYKTEKFETVISKMEEEKLKNLQQKTALTNEKKQKLNELGSCEAELKKKNEEIKRHLDTIKTLKEANKMKEIEKEDLKTKLNESENILQEKSKLAGFSSKLKNELYIKNVEIMSKFNKQQNENADLRKVSKNTEKQLDDNIRALNDKKEEVNKKELQLEEYINKYEKEKSRVKELGKDMDNLLQKIYDTFQTGDKNLIIKGIRKIYNLYLSSDQIKKIDSSKLNINVRDELTKQIDFLQKGILNIADQKTKRETNQNSEIYKKTRENSALTIQLNQKKKDFTELNNQLQILRKNYDTLEKKFKLLQKENNSLLNFSRNNAMQRDQYDSRTQNFDNKTFSATNYNNGFFGNGGLNYMNRTVKSGFGERKSWKDTKLYKGTTLSRYKESVGDANLKSEMEKILDEKRNIITKQKIEIIKLQNYLEAIENELAKKPRKVILSNVNNNSNDTQ